MAENSSPLSASIIRGLTDKLVERRKAAALELERMVRDHVLINDYSHIKEIVSALEHDFTLSSSPNSRKGGLVGIAATAIALGRASIGMHLPELVQPVLACFEDQDARVRYYACESLYNISKVARGAVLVFFNNMFEGLCKLSSDADSNVRYGAELLDRLMKDIVSENPHFDIDNFILLLRDRIYTQDGFARQFLVSWIAFLDSVPDIHMQEHVPEFIDGLFCILGDQRKEIRRMAEETLGELLKEIEYHRTTVRFEAMANIIAVHSQSEDKVIQFTALTWLKVFLDLSQRSMMVFTSNILVSILPCVAYESDRSHIRDAAIAVNDRLKQLIWPEDDEDQSTDEIDQLKDSPFSIHTGRIGARQPPLLASGIPKKPTTAADKTDTTSRNVATATTTTTTTGQTSQAGLKPDQAGQSTSKALAATGSEPDRKEEKRSQSSPSPQPPRELPTLHLLPLLGVLIRHTKFTLQETRMETLRWLQWLHKQLPKRVYKQAGKLFPALLEMLTDQSDKVRLELSSYIQTLPSKRSLERVVRLALQVIANLSTSKASLELESPESHQDQQEQGKTTNKSSAAKTVATTGKGASGANVKGAVVPTPRAHLNKYFRLFLVELLKMFDRDRTLLDQKGGFIVRQMCVYVDAHSVYCTLAEILDSCDNLSFSSLMVQVLNMILFTATELYELRMRLQDLKTQESWSLFTTLYHSWCHNPVATVALCLLSQNYEHASNLVYKFSNVEITAGVLKEVDKLVQLVESPIFAFLRLQLLDPQEHAALVRTLYGLLMLLPQSVAFSSLKQRLSCVPVITTVQRDSSCKRAKRAVPTTVSFDQLLDHFVSMQQMHSQAKRKNTAHNVRTNALAGIR